ncbi:hypothetical protein CJ195_16060 [Bacillus sp. UMB0899]|nr:hypothetical protein CJ195_16060 [Bacillus sp. UMB0899]
MKEIKLSSIICDILLDLISETVLSEDKVSEKEFMIFDSARNYGIEYRKIKQIVSRAIKLGRFLHVMYDIEVNLKVLKVISDLMRSSRSLKPRPGAVVILGYLHKQIDFDKYDNASSKMLYNVLCDFMEKLNKVDSNYY